MGERLRFLSCVFVLMGLFAAEQVDSMSAEFCEIMRLAENKESDAGKTTWSDVVWSPTGDKIAALDSQIYIWDAASGELLNRISTGAGVYAFTWNPDGSQIAGSPNTGGEVEVYIWDATTGELAGTLSGIQNEEEYLPYTTDIAWSPDGSFIASTGRELLLWDVDEQGPPRQLRHYSGDSQGSEVAWSSDSGKLASAAVGAAPTLQLWNTTSGDKLLDIGSSRHVAWSPDNENVVGVVGYQIQVWNITSGEPLFDLKQIEELIGPITTVAWNPNGATIASANTDGVITIYDASSGTQIANLDAHTEMVLAVSWSPEGNQLASASADGTVRVWGQGCV